MVTRWLLYLKELGQKSHLITSNLNLTWLGVGHEHHHYQLLLTKEAGKGGVYTGYSVVPNTTRVLIEVRKEEQILWKQSIAWTTHTKPIHRNYYLEQQFSRLNMCQKFPGGLVETQVARPTPRVSDSVGLG